MSKIDFKSVLNAEQYEVVTAGHGPLLVLAAAGTGKTHTLVHRVAYLLEKGMKQERILLLTFTNKAAREMLDRVNDIVGRDVGGLWGGTFHHLANRILRKHARKIGYNSNYTIIDSADSKTLMGQCIRDLGFKPKEFPKPQVLMSVFGLAVNMETPVEEHIFLKFNDSEHSVDDVISVYDEYEKRKQNMMAMDFDDILKNCLKLLRDEPDVAAKYQAQFDYVLVDEYQDTNTIQGHIIDLLVKGHNNLMVVGDDFQSIYSWRGANFRNIMSFLDRYEGAQKYMLETNYRSVPEVLEVANACIAANVDQFKKVLRSTRESYRKPTVVNVRTGDAQAKYICQYINTMKREGYRYSDMSILYRSHYHSMELQFEFLRQNIPFLITSGIRFFEQVHIKDVCAFLRIILNPGDELSFARLLMMFPGVGPKSASGVWRRLGASFDVFQKSDRENLLLLLKPSAKKHWEDIDKVFDSLSTSDNIDGVQLVNDYVDAFYKKYAEDQFDNADQRLDGITEIAKYIKQYDSLSSFMNEVALLTSLDEEQQMGVEDDVVRLGTIHQAKGLEWPVVIIPWLAEGMFPSRKSIDEESLEKIEEERRLFYVAVTRAKDELCMCVPQISRAKTGGYVPCNPSRFIKEVPLEMVRRERPLIF
ncbi:MAG: ATP-dependent helicase [Kiritimatiellae bacterium]|jgi:DNA helicase-2/ATP-dependent DNA helicase PcrA|nr:ATP-dependent helicase [Kiritimatiellia bacterium]